MQVVLTIKLDSRMKAALQTLAESRFTSVSAAVKLAIEGHLKENGIDWRGSVGNGGSEVVLQGRGGVAVRQRYSKRREAEFHSVEIPGRDNMIRQFNVQQVLPGGVHTILIKEDSVLLDELKVGARMELSFLGSDPNKPLETRSTEVAHISREYEGKFKGHYSVGLRLLPEETLAE